MRSHVVPVLLERLGVIHTLARACVFYPGRSVVDRPAFNRMVVGSIPILGATLCIHGTSFFFVVCVWVGIRRRVGGDGRAVIVVKDLEANVGPTQLRKLRGAFQCPALVVL